MSYTLQKPQPGFVGSNILVAMKMLLPISLSFDPLGQHFDRLLDAVLDRLTLPKERFERSDRSC